MAKPGDKVEVIHAGNTYVGIVMPSASDGILQLKLENGYNIGFKADKLGPVKVIGKQELKAKAQKLKAREGLPTVSIVTTGGTITSKVDYKTGGVLSLTNPEELLASIPELAKIANLRIVNPFNVMSEDMTPREWQKLAKAVADELNSDAQGVIVTHGTDFLALSAAYLSFALKNLGKPVALVGGQRSSDRGSFDGAENLICAVHYCLSDIEEVAVVMHATTEDRFCFAIRGTKARKMHTSRRDAFRPVNDIPLAQIWPDGKIEILNENYKHRSNSKTEADTDFDEKVVLVKYLPGIKPWMLDEAVKKGYKGIIIEAGAMGHVATQPKMKADSWIPSVKNAVQKGVFVGITSQSLYGSVNSRVYSNLRILADAGAVHLNDMLPETAYVKLGYVLGKTHKFADVRKLMLENMAGEYNNRLTEEMFLY